MRGLLSTLGRIVYWLAWPALWIYLRGTTRTRLLLIHDQELLAVRGWLSSGEWSLPGGGLHKQEEVVDGLIREVHEETGVELTANQLKMLGESEARQHGLSFHYIAFVCVLSAKPTVTPQKWEISHAQWLPFDELATVRTDSVLREVVERWRAKA